MGKGTSLGVRVLAAVLVVAVCGTAPGLCAKDKIRKKNRIKRVMDREKLEEVFESDAWPSIPAPADGACGAVDAEGTVAEFVSRAEEAMGAKRWGEARACLSAAGGKGGASGWKVWHATGTLQLRRAEADAAELQERGEEPDEGRYSLMLTSAEASLTRAKSLLLREPSPSPAALRSVARAHATVAELRGRYAEAAARLAGAVEDGDTKDAGQDAHDLNRAAMLAERGGDAAEAVRLLRVAVERAPDSHELANNLATVISRGAGTPAEAAREYGRAARLDPGNGLYLYNRGLALDRDGRAAEALASFRLAAEAGFELPPGRLGAVLDAEGRHAEAAAAFRTAVDALVAGEEAAGDGPFFDRAANLYRALLDATTDSAGADAVLAVAAEASALFEPHAASVPEAAAAARLFFFYAMHTRLYGCKWGARWDADLARLNAGAVADAREALAQGRPPALTPMRALAALAPGPLLEVTRGHAAFIAAEAEARATGAKARSLASPAADLLPRDAGEPLRVAYVSADFGQEHPMAHLTSGLFAAHDRRRVHVACHLVGRPGRGGAPGGCDAYSSLAGQPAHEAAAAILAGAPHAVVDLSGLTGTGEALRVAAAVAAAAAPGKAPLLVSWLGWPGPGVGSTFLHYVVADAEAAADGGDGDQERAILLPSYLVGSHQSAHAGDWLARGEPVPHPSGARRLVLREEAGLPAPGSGIVYASFNQLHKLRPAQLAAWSRVMRAVPRSVLWLLAHPPTAVPDAERALERAGVPLSRVRWAPFEADKAAYLERMSVADLFLDSFEYSAGSTAVDAAWAGLPLLALRGTRTVARMSCSVNRALGVAAELNTGTVEEYVSRAVQLAASTSALHLLRERLWRARWEDRSIVFDLGSWAATFERALVEAHARASAAGGDALSFATFEVERAERDPDDEEPPLSEGADPEPWEAPEAEEQEPVPVPHDEL